MTTKLSKVKADIEKLTLEEFRELRAWMCVQFTPQIEETPPHHSEPIPLIQEDKELFLECFEVIRQEKKASTSNLQRRLRLGYNRAAYVIDYLEKIGVIGPADGAKPREILVDLDTFMLEL